MNEEKMRLLEEAMDRMFTNAVNRAYGSSSTSTSNDSDSHEVSGGTSDDWDEDDWDNLGDEDQTTTEDTSDVWNEDIEETTSSSSTTPITTKDSSSTTSEATFTQSHESTKVDQTQVTMEQWKKETLDMMYQVGEFYKNKRVEQSIKDERKSVVQPKQCNDDVMFRKNTITYNGNQLEYKTLQREVSWGALFNKATTMEGKSTNLDTLNEKILEDIIITFGSLDRITEVMVVSGMLIINGVHYYPMCRDKAFLDALPFDCADYFKSGLIAEFFDFGYLYRMSRLTVIKIDSMDFVVKKFSYDMGITDKFNVPFIFKHIKSLKVFEIGDTVFEAPGVCKDADTTKEVEESIERHSRVSEIYNGYIVGNVNTFRSWTVNNLKTWACNRGDKGFFKYTGGIVSRAGLSALVGIGQLGLMTVGGVVKTGFNLIKKAFTDNI